VVYLAWGRVSGDCSGQLRGVEVCETEWVESGAPFGNLAQVNESISQNPSQDT
jgi:hypothetical protein